ncbi:MAG: alpha/beta fold hydrolase, partial [Gemmatimonadaceae bacterium]
LSYITRTRHPPLVRTSSFLGVILFAATADAQARAGTMNVGDASLRYEVMGSGPALVFINGAALNFSSWDDQVAEFARDHRVIRYDLRGFGKSTGHVDQTAEPDDLRTLLDSLGVRSARIVGLSRGAMVAATFAVRWPERVEALVLYGLGPTPDYPTQPNRAERRAELAGILRTHGIDSLKQFMSTRPNAWIPPNRPDAVERIRRAMADYDGRNLLDQRPPSNRVAPATIPELARLRMPVLLVHGDHETPVPMAMADTLARRIAGVKRVVLRDGGHGAHFAQPDAFNRELRAFLETIARQR